MIKWNESVKEELVSFDEVFLVELVLTKNRTKLCILDLGNYRI